VLDRMGKSERKSIESLLPDLAALCETWMGDGTTTAMNRFNRG
jgi:hypothetical protein